MNTKTPDMTQQRRRAKESCASENNRPGDKTMTQIGWVRWRSRKTADRYYPGSGGYDVFRRDDGAIVRRYLDGSEREFPAGTPLSRRPAGMYESAIIDRDGLDV